MLGTAQQHQAELLLEQMAHLFGISSGDAVRWALVQVMHLFSTRLEGDRRQVTVSRTPWKWRGLNVMLMQLRHLE